MGAVVATAINVSIHEYYDDDGEKGYEQGYDIALILLDQEVGVAPVALVAGKLLLEPWRSVMQLLLAFLIVLLCPAMLQKTLCLPNPCP